MVTCSVGRGWMNFLLPKLLPASVLSCLMFAASMVDSPDDVETPQKVGPTTKSPSLSSNSGQFWPGRCRVLSRSEVDVDCHHDVQFPRTLVPSVVHERTRSLFVFIGVNVEEVIGSGSMLICEVIEVSVRSSSSSSADTGPGVLKTG